MRARSGAPVASPGLPLEGVIVLDFTAFWAGPSATRCLADMGADVIWVERPRSRLDPDEKIAHPAVLAQHLYHLKMNRHKRSVILDLETPAGREAALALAARADIVVENFRPGVADRLGLGPSALCAAFPRLVYVSLSGFGGSGPWESWRSYGPNIEAASSILARTGYAGGEPLRLGHALPDGVGGVAGALAALRGLRERDERGVGGWFDISQLEVYAALSGEAILAASISGAAQPRIGNRSHSGAVQGVFPCRGHDQWIAIRLADQADMDRFAAETGVAVAQDAAGRRAHRRLFIGTGQARACARLARCRTGSVACTHFGRARRRPPPSGTRPLHHRDLCRPPLSAPRFAAALRSAAGRPERQGAPLRRTYGGDTDDVERRVGRNLPYNTNPPSRDSVCPST